MKIDLRDIVTEEFQEEIQNSFAYATGFGVVFVDRNGHHIGPGGNFSRLCQAINADPHGRSCCELSNRRAIALAFQENRPSIFVCHAGMVNIEIPLVYDGQFVGAITAAQVFCDEDCYPRDPVASQVNWRSTPGFAEYYGDIRTLSRQQIEATTTALANLSQYIIERAAYSKAQEELARGREQILMAEKEHAELERQLTAAKFDALQKQVTPHFLFNVINSVSRLISLKEYGTAQQMLVSFARMMRYSAANTSSTIPLGEELEYVREYLSIQKIRFGEQLDYHISCDEGARALRIPFFSLQPLVENAIEHGVRHRPEHGLVELICADGPQESVLTVRDNGVGLSPEALARTRRDLAAPARAPGRRHVGLYNCWSRFHLMYGSAAEFTIDSREGEGTVVRVVLRKDKSPQVLPQAAP